MGKSSGTAGLLVVVAGILVTLYQCAPGTGRSLLTVFFDGVPEEDSLVAGAAPDTLALEPAAGQASPGTAEAGPSLVVHYPYAERECGSCHDPGSLGRMLEPQPELCYMCHEELGSVYPVLHGPVGGGYCTACHDPHSSPGPALLRITGQELCFYCHAEEDVLKNEVHGDLDGMACTDCHNPHGGEDQFILY